MEISCRSIKGYASDYFRPQWTSLVWSSVDELQQGVRDEQPSHTNALYCAIRWLDDEKRNVPMPTKYYLRFSGTTARGNFSLNRKSCKPVCETHDGFTLRKVDMTSRNKKKHPPGRL